MAQTNPLALIALGIGGYLLYTKLGTRPAPVPPVGIRSTPIPRMEPPTNTNYKKWVQTSLNQLMGCGLAVDGVIGPLTKACLIRFQEMWGLVERGTIGAETDYYIKSALGMPGYIEEPFTY